MADLSKMSDAELEAAIAKGRRQLETGFASGPSAAPDRIAVRKEYELSAADLKAQRARLQTYAGTIPRIQRFGELNRVQDTGGIWHKIPGIKDQGGMLFMGGQDTELGEMDAISKGLQVGSVPPGQGAVSNFERELMAGNTPNIKNNGNVNANIRQTLLSAYQQDQDQLAFKEQYLKTNGHLNGASEAWSNYVGANQYTSETRTPSGDSRLVPNPKRQDWRNYFGIEEAPAARPAPVRGAAVRPATARPAASGGPARAAPARPAARPASRPSLDSIWGQ